jgi:hypothetical protein
MQAYIGICGSLRNFYGYTHVFVLTRTVRILRNDNDVSRSLSQDRRRKAKKKAKRGHGDRGD